LNIDIQKIVKETCVEMTRQFKLQGILMNIKFSPYQKTEQLLYNYMNFKQVIEEKNQVISDIQNYGVKNRSKDITRFSTAGKSMIVTDKVQEQIESLESSIVLTKQYIQIIDNALLKISGDAYYDLIRLRYFEGLNREELADHFGVDVATISRNKSRLINILKVHLFSDEVIADIFKTT
jgi:RNA polymerase sigma factor (sigma-70 family)